MAEYVLTRNQAFTDHAGRAGDIIEVANPGDDSWKALIDAGILVEKPADAKPAEPEPKATQPARAAQGSNVQPAGDTPTA